MNNAAKYSFLDKKTIISGNTLTHTTSLVNGYTHTGWKYYTSKPTSTITTSDYTTAQLTSGIVYRLFDAETYYFYGFYTANTYSIEYYTTFNNVLGYVNNTSTYQKTETVFEGKITIPFNSAFKLLDVDSTSTERTVPKGYKFAGWYFFAESDTTNYELTGEAQSSISINTYGSLTGTKISTEMMNGNVQHYSYDGNVHAYAYYEPCTYTIRYVTPADETILDLTSRLNITIDPDYPVESYKSALNIFSSYNGYVDTTAKFNNMFTVIEEQYLYELEKNELYGTTLIGFKVTRTEAPNTAIPANKVFTTADIDWLPGEERMLDVYDDTEGAIVYYAHAIYELALFKIYFYVPETFEDVYLMDYTTEIDLSHYVYHAVSDVILYGDKFILIRYEDTTISNKAYNFFSEGLHIERWFLTSQVYDTSKTVEIDYDTSTTTAGDTITITHLLDWYDKYLKKGEDGYYTYNAFAIHDYTDYYVHYYGIADDEYNYDKNNINDHLGFFIDGEQNYVELQVDVVTFENLNFRYNLDTNLTSVTSKGYAFSKWVPYVKDELGNLSYSDKAYDNNAWRHTYNLFCYADYSPIKYNLYYYTANNNRADVVNQTSSYYNNLVYECTFNTVLTVKDFELIGYDLIGYYVTTSPLTSNVEFVYDPANPDSIDSYITSLMNYKYDQDVLDVSLYPISEITQDWTTENSFKFRYNSNVYAYAIYTPTAYVINYYEPTSNTVDEIYKASMFGFIKSETSEFNAYYSPIEAIAVKGYTFQGWYVSTSPVSANLSLYTDTYLSSLQVNTTSAATGSLAAGIHSDNGMGTEYKQNWASNSTFRFRYTADVYAYAYYKPNSYKAYYYDINDNKVGSINNLACYSVRGLSTGMSYVFNSTFTVSDALLSAYNYTFSTPGYTFIGFHISKTKLTSGTYETPYPASSDVGYENSYWNNVFNGTSIVKSDSEISNTFYRQMWNNGDSFYYRFTEDIHIYALYTVDSFNITYYQASNNFVGSANNIAAYIKIDIEDTAYTTCEFNANYKTYETSLVGYTLKGWKVFDSLQTSGTISGETANEYENSYLVNTTSNTQTISSDSGAGTSYCQNWTPGNTIIWRNTNDVYAYAYYEANEYTLHFYNTKSNQVGYVNNTSHYYNTSAFNIKVKFNDKLLVHDITTGFNFQINDVVKASFQNIVGYNFIGFYLSYSELPAATTVTESAYSYISSSEYDEASKGVTYKQDWTLDSLKTTTDKYFYYRDFTSQNLYLYAYYEVTSYTVKYYWTESNTVYLNSTRYGVEHANDVTYYHDSGSTETLYLNYNDSIVVKSVSLNGYTFNGWLVFDSSQYGVTTTISGISDYYLTHYTVNSHDTLAYGTHSDSNLGVKYKQTWTPSNEFVYRYTHNIYAYASYTANVYQLHFYYSDYDVNDPFYGTGGTAVEVANSFYDEAYMVNTHYTEYKTIEITFNKPLNLDYATYNLNLSGDRSSEYLPFGYDFYYWIFSRKPATTDKSDVQTIELINEPIYDDANNKFYSSETTWNASELGGSGFKFQLSTD